jgi:hypothetical protein
MTMKPSPAWVGKTGLTLIALSVAIAINAAIVVRTQFQLGLILIFVGCGLYLPGGFMTVSHFGYTRGSKVYLSMMMMRMTLAACAMLVLVETLKVR